MSASGRYNSLRFLGLDLGGAKTQKTTITTLEYYPKEEKTFLLEVIENIGADPDLLEILAEIKSERKEKKIYLAVNAATTLPPYIPSPKKSSPSVKWSEQLIRKAEKKGAHPKNATPEIPRLREFTPYTQRPVELWLRYFVLPELKYGNSLEVDEALGGNRAPLTARMVYLKNFLKGFEVREIFSKLSTAILLEKLNLPRALFEDYRHFEKGAGARGNIIEALADAHNVFIYDRDVIKLAKNLGSFDAFIAAFSGLLHHQGQTAAPPRDFPLSSGWIHYPEWD